MSVLGPSASVRGLSAGQAPAHVARAWQLSPGRGGGLLCGRLCALCWAGAGAYGCAHLLGCTWGPWRSVRRAGRAPVARGQHQRPSVRLVLPQGLDRVVEDGTEEQAPPTDGPATLSLSSDLGQVPLQPGHKPASLFLTVNYVLCKPFLLRRRWCAYSESIPAGKPRGNPSGILPGGWCLERGAPELQRPLLGPALGGAIRRPRPVRLRTCPLTAGAGGGPSRVIYQVP